MKTKFFREGVIWALSLIPFIYLLIIWDYLPEKIPTHWNYKGEVDSYSGKNTAFLLAGLPLVIQVLMNFLPAFDPKRENYASFQGSYYKLRLLITLFFSFLSGMILYVSATNQIASFTDIISVSICLLFAGIGNYMGTIKPNYFTGVRTPWTLSDEEIWRKTHKFAGKLWFFGGLILALVVVLFPSVTAFIILSAGIIVLALIPVLYSYLLFREKS